MGLLHRTQYELNTEYSPSIWYIIEATVDFGYDVCFWMQYITGYTTELSASFLFWSGKVHITSDLLNFTPMWARASLLTCCSRCKFTCFDRHKLQISHLPQIRSQGSITLPCLSGKYSLWLYFTVCDRRVGSPQDMSAAGPLKGIAFNMWVHITQWPPYQHQSFDSLPYLRFCLWLKKVDVAARTRCRKVI